MQKLSRNIESKQTKFNNWNLISSEKGRLFMKISEPSTSHLLLHPALTIIKIMAIVYYVGRPHFQWQWFLPLILGFKACKMHWLPLLNLSSSIITSNVLISHTDIVIYFLNINILLYLFLSFSTTIHLLLRIIPASFKFKFSHGNLSEGQ